MARNDAPTTADEYQDLLVESTGFTVFLRDLGTVSASQLGADGSNVECTITVERNGSNGGQRR